MNGNRKKEYTVCVSFTYIPKIYFPSERDLSACSLKQKQKKKKDVIPYHNLGKYVKLLCKMI